MRKSGRMRIGMWTPSVGSHNATSVEATGTLRANVLLREKDKAMAKLQTEKERQRAKERTKDKERALAAWYAGHATSLGIGQSTAPRTRVLAMLRKESLLTILALKKWSYRLVEFSG